MGLQRLPLSFGLLLWISGTACAFVVERSAASGKQIRLFSAQPTGIATSEKATELLSEWDRLYNADVNAPNDQDCNGRRGRIPAAVRLLNDIAIQERARDSTKGRVMLGICASTSYQGLAALKAWVDALDLPRGLLHGMDKDGVPLEIEGGVYIKYNTGGSITFSEIRRSGVGFDALWKPGDALLEPYDGTFRGVYFQVELSDDVFRQYLVPLDTFGP
jgi:Domain of unknown function (DUF1824)